MKPLWCYRAQMCSVRMCSCSQHAHFSTTNDAVDHIWLLFLTYIEMLFIVLVFWQIYPLAIKDPGTNHSFFFFFNCNFFYPYPRTFFSPIAFGERKGERSIDWLPPVHAWTRDHTLPDRGSNTQPRHVPFELNPQPLGCGMVLPTTEPHWPGIIILSWNCHQPQRQSKGLKA